MYERGAQTALVGQTPHLEPMRDPRPHMKSRALRFGRTLWTGRIPIAHLVTTFDAIDSAAASGRLSETPDAPIELCLREGVPGRFEICDGHHRLAAVLRRGELHANVEIIDQIDDEPYEPPYATFPHPTPEASR